MQSTLQTCAIFYLHPTYLCAGVQVMASLAKKGKRKAKMGNALLALHRKQMLDLPVEYNRLLDPKMDEEQRGDLFEAEDAEKATPYAWAIPDERALRICASCAPLVEIGCGKGYWAKMLRERKIEISAFDKVVDEDAWTEVRAGGSEVLAEAQFSEHSLMLCYPGIFWCCFLLPALNR